MTTVLRLIKLIVVWAEPAETFRVVAISNGASYIVYQAIL